MTKRSKCIDMLKFMRMLIVYYNIRAPKANFFRVIFRKNFSGILCSRSKHDKSTAGHMPRRAPYDSL